MSPMIALEDLTRASSPAGLTTTVDYNARHPERLQRATEAIERIKARNTLTKRMRIDLVEDKAMLFLGSTLLDQEKL